MTARRAWRRRSAAPTSSNTIPTGTTCAIYASGIRNPVTIAFYPGTHTICGRRSTSATCWATICRPITSRVVKPGGFYGWPWFYIGGNQDPRHKGEHDELQEQGRWCPTCCSSRIRRRSASPSTPAAQFPASYRGSAFVALHGSWNRAQRTGYKIVRIPVKNGKPTGAYEDFMTGFVTGDGDVWGRPVGVAVAQDGALLVSDDGSGTVWRISYTGEQRAAAIAAPDFVFRDSAWPAAAR